MNLKNILTTCGAAFLTGVAASLATVPVSQLFTWQSAKPFVVAAVAAGITAVYHLYQPVPNKQS